MKCKIHPKYQAKKAPTSTKEGCTCGEIWESKKKKGPAPHRTPYLMPLYMMGNRHIGYKCSECGGTGLVRKPVEHLSGCVVLKEKK